MPTGVRLIFLFQLIYRSVSFIAENINDIFQHYKLSSLQNRTLIKEFNLTLLLNIHSVARVVLCRENQDIIDILRRFDVLCLSIGWNNFSLNDDML